MKRRRWMNWLPRFPVADDVDREIKAHIAMRTRELMDDGWKEDDAHNEAVRLFGNRDTVAEACRRLAAKQDRAQRRARMFATLWHDVKFGFRLLIRSPGFTAVAVLTLTLGIGANTAVFSVVHGVMFRPLPFEDPDRLVSVREVNDGGGDMQVAWANFVDWEQEVQSLSAMAAYGAFGTTVLGADQPLRLNAARVSQGFWAVYPQTPAAGRFTTPADHLEGAEPVLIISRALWENRFGSAPLEQIRLEVSGVRWRVVGVAEAGFHHPGAAEVWMPLEPVASGSTSRSSHNWLVEGRLAPGATIEQARQELDALTRVLVAQDVESDPRYLATGASVVSLRDQVVGDYRRVLWMLLGAAGLVLIVACTNLASTLLARGTGRAREFAVRTSLGAGKSRIVRQLLTESLLLAAIGGTAGVAFGALLLRGVVRYGGESIPRIGDVSLNLTVLMYTGAVAVGAALFFGLFPALRLLRTEPGQSLRGGGRGNTVDHRARVWRLLIGVEVALSLVLLASSGLLVRSFQTLLSADRGFNSDDVLATTLALSRIKYETPQDHARWHTEMLGQVTSLPGVNSAGILSLLPVNGWAPNGQMELDGDLTQTANAAYIVASGGAFTALDVPLRAGRFFEPQDNDDNEFVAIVSESFAERYWPGQDPIGRQVTGGGMDNFWEERPFARVVGVVGDLPFWTLEDQPTPTVYFPYTQRPFRIQFGAQLVVESSGPNPNAVAPSVRNAIEALDSDIPIELTTLDDHVLSTVRERRLTTSLLGGFSLIALMLAGVGIYGVVSYSVARRTREMGVRIALGATPTSVRRMVLGSSMRLVAGGLVVGLIGALLAVRLLTSLLYSVSPTDPLTFAAVMGLILATALLASWVPAFMGTKVDPTVTMRAE